MDDLTDKHVGYAFVADKRNKALSSVTQRGQLIQGVLEGEGDFAHHANVMDDGEIEWNKGALRAWLQDYAEMHQLLLLRAEMLSGAPSRGTELTALTYGNTKTRPMRSLVMLGKHLTILCQYMKTTALTGQEKLIPHALDAVTSDILIQDLTLARPFAEIAAHVCFPDKPHVRELYRNQLFVNFNRLFTSEDLSAVMTKYSLPHLNYALTINPWRHIQTAWKHKFRCAWEAIQEDDMIDNVEALQAGHTRATENRIYGLSVHTLAGAPEDVLPCYLEASTSWQKQCRTVPGGTLLPYNQAHCHNATVTTTTSTTTSTTSTSTTTTSSKAQLDALHNCRDTYAPAALQDIAQQVVALLTPSLSALVHDAVTKALISGHKQSHATQTPITLNKGKGKAVEQPTDITEMEDNSDDEGDDLGLRLGLQQEAEMNSMKRAAAASDNQGEGVCHRCSQSVWTPNLGVSSVTLNQGHHIW